MLQTAKKPKYQKCLGGVEDIVRSKMFWLIKNQRTATHIIFDDKYSSIEKRTVSDFVNTTYILYIILFFVQ